MKKLFIKYKWALLLLSFLSLLALCGVLLISRHVQEVGRERLVAAEDAPQADAILILGARVFANGDVSLMLNDRLTVGWGLYEQKKAGKILVSGDHGRKDYDEVNTMKDYLLARGVVSQNIFMDHAGFSTYESLYRARDIFQVKKVLIVTQGFHLLRALYIARSLGLEAYGVPADLHVYNGFMLRSELREIAARNKDFLTAGFLKPKPKFLGEVIPVSGDGRLTDDRQKN